ncbi:hypothetical protein KR018_000993 [Drosophila ironensis]|nr:hypothetical protein KR018_000993 [Drosophila ironensis]
MFKKSVTDLTKVPQQKVKEWLGSIKTVLFDADGVLWHFLVEIPGAAAAFKAVQDSGRKVFIVSNNSAMPSPVFAERAAKCGFHIEESHVVTSALSIAHYLLVKGFHKKAFVMGEQGIGYELNKVDIQYIEVDDKMDKPMEEFVKEIKLDPDVGAVVVGRDERFNMARVMRASAYLQNPDVLFLGTSMDAAYPIMNRTRVIVGASAMLTSVKALSGRPPLVMGKPNCWIVDALIRCKQIEPESTLMVGDTLTTDMLFASNCGFQSLLVGTGTDTFEWALKAKSDKRKELLVPDVYLPSLGHLKQFLT